jgi:hypothetical protein
MTKYNLVNPFIEGNMNTSVKASDELKGAGKIYEEILAPMFITSVSEFQFSIEGGGKLYHYNVKESVKDNNAKFKIEEISGKVETNKLKNKLKELNKGKDGNDNDQDGGKSKHKHKHDKDKDDDDDDDSSSSSSDESYYKFNRFYYSPYIYTPYINTGYSYTLPYISPTYFYPYSSLNIWGWPYYP